MGTAPDQRLLILTPTGRDGQLTAELLLRAGLDVEVCESIAELCRSAGEGAAGLLIAEEVLIPKTVKLLAKLLAEQEPWSDLPIVLFTGEGATVQARQPTKEALAPLGNVTLLERPVRPATMLAVVRSALRARLRQYRAREALAAEQRAVRERDQFLAMLGHELRNPLNAVLMAVDLLERQSGDPAHHRAVLRRQGAMLARLVDDLLDVSRVTTGKIVLKRTALDLREVARRCLHSMDAAISAQRLAVVFTAPRKPVLIDGDPVRIEQVVANLMTNAAKYTPAGGQLELRVEARRGAARLRVCDSGVGIAPEMLPRVFDLFVQAEGSLDRAAGGMGIGLTLVRALVELHGGRVSITSDGVGRGTQVTVSFPRIAAPSARSPEVAGRYPHPTRPSRRILLVEDNADSRDLMQHILELNGHCVESVGDGLAAAARAVQGGLDVLIIDIGLPLLDGYTVAQRARAALGPEVFMIALTGYGQPEDRRRALEAGFDVHLTKPVDLRALETLLGSPELQAAAAPAP